VTKDSANFLRTVEIRQGLKIACPEEIAFDLGYIDADAVRTMASGQYRNTNYGDYLISFLAHR
jgi:glucose-1-phosphate thymidylyltransferase